ncbi:UNVERIFIED_CONTAM: mRNA turnover and ribosome assembly protein [Siphonaria sp. JEL0065]|nr:mRNA turnover and ribosome assembly protein [Siphonaria sp. JEL0065]
MAKSRRNKVMTMTKTEKKGKDSKSILFEKVRNADDANDHCYVISVSNMRNSILKAMRMGMKDKNSTTFFFGNNRVIAKALGGPDREDEYKDGNPKYRSFSEYVLTDFARNGVIATHTITLPAGPVLKRVEAVEMDTLDESLAPTYLSKSKDEVMASPNNMETQLRGLVRKRSMIPSDFTYSQKIIMRDFTICTAGEPLTTNQAQLLKHFNYKMAKFNVRIVGHWSGSSGYETVDGAADEEAGEGAAADEDMENDE